ncbi:hypothetical protein HUH30_004326 [Salmonella enterica]|nr:hypothetical protein [Salmonella enterica]
MTTITKERLLKIQHWRETYGADSNVMLPAEEAEELARIALAALEAEPEPVVPESISVRQAISALESADCVTTIGQAYKMGWNACRAALLQGGQPVSNRDELQVIGWLRSDYNSDDKRDPNAPLFMLGSNDPSEAWGVKYIPLSGNTPAIPDDWVMVPKEPTQAMIKAWLSEVANFRGHAAGYKAALAAAPQREVK